MNREVTKLIQGVHHLKTKEEYSGPNVIIAKLKKLCTKFKTFHSILILINYTKFISYTHMQTNKLM